MIRRRAFITLLGGAAAAWSFPTSAQQPKVPTIGFLGATTAAIQSQWTAAFVQRLGELGWVEGRTVTIEYRWAEGRSDRLPEIFRRADALIVPPDVFLLAHRIRINTLALGARLPTMHGSREYVEAGGLMSYGPNYSDLFRRSADYVDRILRGAKPADLPVEQPTKFDLIINLTTGKALGLEIPPMLLGRADEVIE
jgi:putative tryptophan/tyrosine transport system substrate-binding protein